MILAKKKVWHSWQLKKIKILVAIFELPAKQFSPFGPFLRYMGWIGTTVLAGSSKTASRISIFSNAIGANHSCKIWANAFFNHNNSFLATVYYQKLVIMARRQYIKNYP